MTTPTINDQLVELGVLGDQQDKSIQQTGATFVDKFLQSFDTEADDNTTVLVLHYLTDIQVRDYALGLLCIYDTQQVLDALNFLLEQAPTDTAFINAPAALLATLLYERGDSASAAVTLTNAQQHYALGMLLRRIMEAGWPASSFATMREQLHPKVTKGIFGEEVDE